MYSEINRELANLKQGSKVVLNTVNKNNEH